jgi:hypothetical protein
MDILIDETGDAHFIYDDTLAEVFAGEPQETKRASHVEPHPSRTGWVADMRPSGGPILGHGGEWRPQTDLPLDYIGDLERHFVGMLDPFATRQSALDAERAWLREHKGL